MPRGTPVSLANDRGRGNLVLRFFRALPRRRFAGPWAGYIITRMPRSARLLCALAAPLLAGAPGRAQAQVHGPPLPPPEPALIVHNPAPAAQRGWIAASLPLPRGRHRELRTATVGSHAAQVRPLLRWPDGSLALVQLHWRQELAAGAWEAPKVHLEPAPGPAPGVSGWVLGADLPLHTEVEDPWGRIYRARFEPDPTAGPDGYLRRGPATRIRRFRAQHRRGEHGCLGLLAWLQTWAGERRAVLTLALDNNAYGVGPAVGPLRLRRFSLVVEDPQLRTLPRDWVRQGIAVPEQTEQGHSRIDLLPSSPQLYLGDRTAKCFRMQLFADGPDVPKAARQQAAHAAQHPVLALPDLSWTRHTRAFSAHGGPAPGPQRPGAHARWIDLSVVVRSDQGPFGSYGRGRDPAAQGTPHNGPMVLHNVLRLASPRLLHHAESMVLQHSLFPTPGLPTRLPAATASLRQGMSKWAMDVPHGYHRMDYEHFAVGLLYDYYWLTGDPLARRELQRLGEGLRAVLEDLPFLTSRGEGWCMQSGVLIARATGDRALVDHLDRRFAARVRPALAAKGAPSVLPQPGHRDAFGAAEPFDAPWQIAALVHGLHAMWAQTGKAEYAALIQRSADVMAGPGWEEGKGPKYLVHAQQLSRYRMPVGHGPLEGTAWMQLGAFVLAREMSEQRGQRERYGARIAQLVAPWQRQLNAELRGNPWLQLYLDRSASWAK